MSLERQDIRAKLDHEMHLKLKAICEVDGVDMGVFIEAVLVPVIEKRCHDAMLLAAKLPRPGITGNNREWPGMGGK
jgi:hypothetical protein